MIAQQDSDSEQIDHRTSRSICDAVGERLQQSLRTEGAVPEQLLALIEQLRRNDGDLN